MGDRIDWAESSAGRRRGLLGRTSLALGEGFYISPCEAVHSFFMKFPIDVLHLDRAKRVTKIRAAMKPWRVSVSFSGQSVLELPAGAARRTRTSRGDQLQFTRVAALALCGLCFFPTACAKRTITVAAPPTVFDRQVRNAIDAGDGDFELAHLRERVLAAPANLAFRLELASAYEAKGYPELTIDHYRLAIAQHADAPEPQLRLARALVAVHHQAEAISGYSAFLANHPGAAPLYMSWLGILEDDAGDWKAGEIAHRDALRRAIALGQESDYLHNNLGFCLLTLNQHEEAAAEFRAALRLKPTSEIARHNLATALATDAHPNAAEAILNFQSVNEPAAAHNNMAALLIEQGRYPQARQEIDQALAFNRTYPAALRNLQILAELEGKPAMLSLNPLPAAAHSRMGRVKLAVSRYFRGTPTAAPTAAEPIQTASRTTESSQ